MSLKDKMREFYLKLAQRQGDKICWFCGAHAPTGYSFKSVEIEVEDEHAHRVERYKAYICDKCEAELEMHVFLHDRTTPASFWDDLQKLENHPGGPQYVKIMNEFITKWQEVAKKVIGIEYTKLLLRGFPVTEEDKNESENK